MTPLDDPTLHRALAALPHPEAPPTLAPRIMAAVRQRQTGQIPQAASGVHPQWVIVTAAAGLAIAASASVWGPETTAWLPRLPQLPHTPASVATVAAIIEAGALTLKTLYASAAPWVSAVALAAALCCVPSLLLLERLTETRA